MRLGMGVVLALLGVLSGANGPSSSGAGADNPQAVRWRQPAAVAWSADGTRALVANQLSGSVSLVNLVLREVESETSLGVSLVDIRRLGTSDTFLLADQLGHELIAISLSGSELAELWRLPVARYPVSIAVDEKRNCCVVASLWSRRLSYVLLPDPAEMPRLLEVLDLAFAPQCQAVAGDQLVVADAFGPELAVVSLPAFTVQLRHRFSGFQTRGMALDAAGRRLVLSQQMINELAHATRNDVHWGLMVSNELRWVDIDALQPAASATDVKMVARDLGGAGNAKGDPSAVVVTSDGTALAVLSGVNQLAVGAEDRAGFYFLDVGVRPVAVALSPDERSAVVANWGDDSISIIDLQPPALRATVSLGLTPPLDLVQRGERLFFDARMSHDGWMSCHTCHPGGHTNGMLNDNLSDQSFGAPKRVLSLLGGAGTDPFAWNGSAPTLQDQLRNSIAHTMQADQAPADDQVQALAAFLGQLAPAPGLDPARQLVDPAATQRGETLFAQLRCVECHRPPRFTSVQLFDVGLEDEFGSRRFNPPSLLGVSQRDTFFHDARAGSLGEVLVKYQHQLSEPLSPAQVAELLAYLRSL